MIHLFGTNLGEMLVDALHAGVVRRCYFQAGRWHVWLEL